MYVSSDQPLTGSGPRADGGAGTDRLRVAVCCIEGHVWQLPHRPEAAGTARRLVRSVLRRWGVEEDAAEQAVLAVSELVTNAVEHALPPLVLQVLRPDTATLHIEVTDGGPAEQPGEWMRSCAPEEHGRGSDIIDFLATAHGRRTGEGHAACWADLPAAA